MNPIRIVRNLTVALAGIAAAGVIAYGPASAYFTDHSRTDVLTVSSGDISATFTESEDAEVTPAVIANTPKYTTTNGTADASLDAGKGIPVMFNAENTGSVALSIRPVITVSGIKSDAVELELYEYDDSLLDEGTGWCTAGTDAVAETIDTESNDHVFTPEPFILQAGEKKEQKYIVYVKSGSLATEQYDIHMSVNGSAVSDDGQDAGLGFTTGNKVELELFKQPYTKRKTFKIEDESSDGGYRYEYTFYKDKVDGFDDSTADMPAENPTRTGYIFDKWESQPDSTSDEKVYVPKWNPIHYTIEFNANNTKEVGGTMADMTGVEYDKEVTLTKNAFTKTGYKLKGWNTEADGTGTSYADEEKVQNLAADDGAEVTLYAVWEVQSYTAKFFGTDGTLYDTITRNYGEALGTLETPWRSGHTFKGWFTEETGGTEVTESTTMPANDVSYYAIFDLETYDITYNLKGNATDEGGNFKAADESTLLKTYTAETPDYEVPSPEYWYEFKGWSFKNPATETTAAKAATRNLALYTSQASNGLILMAAPRRAASGFYDQIYRKLVLSPTTMGLTGDLTLYSIYDFTKPVTYRVEYDLKDKGRNVENNLTKYTYETSDWTLEDPVPKKDDSGNDMFVFTGWTGSRTEPSDVKGKTLNCLTSDDQPWDGKSSVSKPIIPKGTHGNLSFVATWGSLLLNIDYGNGTTAIEHYSYDNGKTVLKPDARTGYTFTGWTATLPGTAKGKQNDDGSYTIEPHSMGTISLTANWNPHIVFDANGGSGGKDYYLAAGTSLSRYFPSLTAPTNKVFDGWYDARTGGNKINTSTATMPNGPTTYYAYWKDDIPPMPGTIVYRAGATNNLCTDVTVQKFSRPHGTGGAIYDSSIKSINGDVIYGFSKHIVDQKGIHLMCYSYSNGTDYLSFITAGPADGHAYHYYFYIKINQASSMCMRPDETVSPVYLKEGESVVVAAGDAGWLLARPRRQHVQAYVDFDIIAISRETF